ncbi:protein-methionine-sulfoxide reductase heme-binding subunit MsrQ [Primorskyibacter sp. 2E107]|uniref:protein-methionine-sulfoxide reductase heme-binding subunit MsrQ n=1 Tax=Primorskyibacter sp. 2E107 TaxID=3403458 RepID=UPI003AF6FA9A
MINDRINAAARKVPTWLVYILCALPAPWMFYQGLTGGLGVEPIKALEHEYGQLALQFLIAGLVITPLRRFAGVNLLRFRRAIGLMAFFYVTAHLAVWLVLDVQVPAQIWADIVKRPYITIGMAGFLLLVPLAVTSNMVSIRRLGRTWQKLHKLVYSAALLGALHFVLLVKGFQIEPLLYMGAVLVLLAMRVKWRSLRLPRAPFISMG